jgi:alpha-L-fucosidase
MVCIGPDEFGKFHPKAVEQLDEVGRWLKVNGQGIYETRLRDVWKEGDIYFTRSKDHKQVFAFVEKWTGTELLVPSVTPQKGSKVFMFGYKKPLKWTQTDKGVQIILPQELQKPENRPCQYAWGFQFKIN